ncbi:hypothetical protein CBS147333_9381 [Penicillium roqueforti]|nr:hypothetical protein CBS147333_9381 [Penicillium roqueforti]KAI3191022.1 hypothetical protein CBS147311_9611 [Penicillium roqueforti]KAI3261724.1 hypothetical protein CBS147308_9685 [Penicillium roqueforti]KAI3279371.1 hypothetical protein DTO003C3_9872 [Penicillium roqueforti]
MPPPQQPTELIYCAASVCVPNRKREYQRRRTEDIRPQCTSARNTALCHLFVLGLGHQKFEPLTSHQSGPEDTGSR